jgi:glycosyltransferase involved in cell wall biosynthesis
MTVLLSFLTYGPYHLARLAAARARGEAGGFEVAGLAMSRFDSDYSWEMEKSETVRYAVEDMTADAVPADAWIRHLEPVLDEIRPDVCAIAGYSHPAMLALISLCGKRSIPWILMSDSREVDLPRTRWREWSKSRIVRLASAGFAAGRVHIEYLEKLGLGKNACSVGYDVVDNAYFSSEAAKWKAVRASGETPGPNPEGPFFLASNRFIPKKNLFRLLDAYLRYADPESGSGAPWPLVLLGDGELKPSVIAHAASLGLPVRERAPWEPPATQEEPVAGNQPEVFFPGFRQIGELPRFYAHAGAFVHASTTEQWGLVVNEAMASGLPVLVSKRCGCAPELVREGINGFTFDPLDVDELARQMTRIASMEPSELGEFGAAGQRLIADWGLERFAAGLADAAKRAIRTGPRKTGLLERILLFSLSRR